MRATGEIGPLHVGQSDRAAVEAFAGRPDAVREGREPGNFPYVALGYECGSRTAAVRLAHGGPSCKTAFFLDRGSGKLETFFTSSPAIRRGTACASG